MTNQQILSIDTLGVEEVKMAKKKISITSDLVNRILKIREGLVYNDIATFIDELVQNSQRASATVVKITLEDDFFQIEDNGTGCSNPEEDLFQLDVSGFGIGYGEGFSSIYAVADYFEVKSLNWIAKMNLVEALNRRNLNLISLEKSNDYKQGFIVSLKGEKIAEHSWRLERRLNELCSIIPHITFYINGEKVEYRNLFDLEEDYQYQKKFLRKIKKRGRVKEDAEIQTIPSFSEIVDKNEELQYAANLALLPKGRSGYINVYFDYRYVTDIYFEGATGSVLVGANTVNLKAPDRKSIIYDNKRSKFIEDLREDISSLIKNLLNEGNSDSISEYAETIELYLDVKEYIKYLTIDKNDIPNQFETRQKSEQTIVKEEKEQNNDISYIQQIGGDGDLTIGEIEQSISSIKSNSQPQNNEEVYQEETTIPSSQSNYVDNEYVQEESQRSVDTKRQEEDQKFNSYVKPTQQQLVSKEDIDEINIKNIKSKKNIVWVQKSEISTYKEFISQYEYYGIFTFISPHVLYDKALEFIGIPHISTVQDEAIEKQYEVKRIGAISKKEERAMEILSFIEDKLHLPKTFYISDIKCKMIVSLRGSKLYQQNLQVEGYAKGGIIHLNRKSLDFGKLNSTLLGRNTIGVHDLKFVLSNIELIAHELAHVIYGTKDNTVEHFEAQNKIQKSIGDMFMENDTLY